MQDAPTTYVRSALAVAKDIVPLGVRRTTSGGLAFDEPDAALLEDIATLLREACAQDTTRLQAQLADQKATLSEVMSELMADLAWRSGTDKPDLSLMLASTFDRFPQFADFLALAAGCGDLSVDPLHPKYALGQELSQTPAGAGGTP